MSARSNDGGDPILGRGPIVNPAMRIRTVGNQLGQTWISYKVQAVDMRGFGGHGGQVRRQVVDEDYRLVKALDEVFDHDAFGSTARYHRIGHVVACEVFNAGVARRFG